MFLIFFKNCAEFVGKIFGILFGIESNRLERLYNIDISTWKTLARPAQTEEGVLYVFNYENKIIRDALYYIKNKKDKKLLEIIVRIVGDAALEELSEKSLMENFVNPIIIAIPTTLKQKHKRGFNPSELLAEELAHNLNIPYLKNVLNKIKDTKPQKTLSRRARLDNIKNSMELNAELLNELQNKSIIVVDDIVTTGATLKEARRALIKGGVKNVMCVAVAH